MERINNPGNYNEFMQWVENENAKHERFRKKWAWWKGATSVHGWICILIILAMFLWECLQAGSPQDLRLMVYTFLTGFGLGMIVFTKVYDWITRN